MAQHSYKEHVDPAHLVCRIGFIGAKFVGHVGVALHDALGGFTSQHALLYVALSVNVAIIAAWDVASQLLSMVSNTFGVWLPPHSLLRQV